MMDTYVSSKLVENFNKLINGNTTVQFQVNETLIHK